MSQAHTALVTAILLAHSCRPGLTLWKNHTGGAFVRGGGFMKFGLKGGSDILGVAAPAGRFVAIEVKIGRDVLKPEQRTFRRIVLEHGGLFIEARCPEIGFIDRAVEQVGVVLDRELGAAQYDLQQGTK